MPRVAQDRAGGQREAEERRDHKAQVARHGLEVGAEGEEQRNDADGCSEHPEQVRACLL